MKDIITYDSLLCPTTQLEDALRNIFCKFRCAGNDSLVVYFDSTSHNLTVTLNGVSSTTTVINTDSQQLSTSGTNLSLSNGNTISLTALVKLAETNTTLSLSGNSLIFTNEDGVVTTINLLLVVKQSETITSVINNANGTSTFINEAGTQVSWKRGGISSDAGNTLVNGSDGLPYAPVGQSQIVTTIINTVTGHKIADYVNEANVTRAINETITSVSLNSSNNIVSYTNEAGIIQTFLAGGISSDSLNLAILGTDGKIYVKKPQPQTDVFSVTTGSSVTLSFTPDVNYLVQVFRNGMRQQITVDYTITGTTITFVNAFSATTGGVPPERVLIDYYK